MPSEYEPLTDPEQVSTKIQKLIDSPDVTTSEFGEVLRDVWVSSHSEGEARLEGSCTRMYLLYSHPKTLLEIQNLDINNRQVGVLIFDHSVDPPRVNERGEGEIVLLPCRAKALLKDIFHGYRKLTSR